ncbi:MAG: class I SAM-dependent methyltransferase [Candidatus Pacebacteria bacterium]|nr:class I SAM-dependent methyltransferase [Candidatus Paceibacterota bacterium]MBP9851525.1 class I SAM-dependent methyltransferase [Candidatus Paceibacterota bacterium]
MKLFFRKIRHKAIINKLRIPANASVLDTSCEDGSFLSVLLSKNQGKNLKLYGIDINEREIEKAKALIPEASFTATDNKSIPFPDRHFDVVISSMTLHHMSNPSESINEMKRVLRENGSIYLVDIIAKNRLFYFFLKRLKCPAPYHFEKFYFLPDLEKLLSGSGLKVMKTNRSYIIPVVNIVMQVLVLEVKTA